MPKIIVATNLGRCFHMTFFINTNMEFVYISQPLEEKFGVFYTKIKD